MSRTTSLEKRLAKCVYIENMDGDWKIVVIDQSTSLLVNTPFFIFLCPSATVQWQKYPSCKFGADHRRKQCIHAPDDGAAHNSSQQPNWSIEISFQWGRSCWEYRSSSLYCCNEWAPSLPKTYAWWNGFETCVMLRTMCSSDTGAPAAIRTIEAGPVTSLYSNEMIRQGL